MNAFAALAGALHERLVGCNEDACRNILEERVRLHFGLF